jgi:hypothetical protein
MRPPQKIIKNIHNIVDDNLEGFWQGPLGPQYQGSIGNFDTFYNIKAMASVQIIVKTFAGRGVVVKVALVLRSFWLFSGL